MKLEGKKAFIAEVLGVGKGRIVLNSTRLQEIKESLTRQDIRDLYAQGAILVKDPRGRKKVEKRTIRRKMGSIKKRPINTKRKYMHLTRKLRAFIAHLRIQGKLTDEKYKKIRTQIRASAFNSLGHLKEHLNLEAKS